MKIAVPTTADKLVDSHFGHTEFFTVYSLDENKNILNSEVITTPQECGCKSGIASVLREMGVEIMLAGNMGPGAVNVLSDNGISVYRGCSGIAEDVVNEFAKGLIEDSGESCCGHGEGHQCNH